MAAGGKFVTVGPSDRAIWFRINGGHDVLPKYVLQSMEDTGGSMHVSMRVTCASGLRVPGPLGQTIVLGDAFASAGKAHLCGRA